MLYNDLTGCHSIFTRFIIGFHIFTSRFFFFIFGTTLDYTGQKLIFRPQKILQLQSKIHFLWGFICLALWSRAHQAKLLNCKSCLAESSQNKSLSICPLFSSSCFFPFQLFPMCATTDTTWQPLAVVLTPLCGSWLFLYCFGLQTQSLATSTNTVGREDADVCLLTRRACFKQNVLLCAPCLVMKKGVVFTGHIVLLSRLSWLICRIFTFFTFIRQDLYRSLSGWARVAPTVITYFHVGGRYYECWLRNQSEVIILLVECASRKISPFFKSSSGSNCSSDPNSLGFNSTNSVGVGTYGATKMFICVWVMKKVLLSRS